MSEILNLWSENVAENKLLLYNFHPQQKEKRFWRKCAGSALAGRTSIYYSSNHFEHAEDIPHDHSSTECGSSR